MFLCIMISEPSTSQPHFSLLQKKLLKFTGIMLADLLILLPLEMIHWGITMTRSVSEIPISRRNTHAFIKYFTSLSTEKIHISGMLFCYTVT